MKNLQQTLYFLFLSVALLACREHSADFECRLAMAETLMDEQPDSAYCMLCAMNEEAEHLPEDQRMRHLLLRSNAQNKVYVDFTSDSIGNALVEYFDVHGSPNERMLAHYIKGCTYRDMQDQPAALRCYNDAVAAADTASVGCDFRQLSILNGQIAKIFNERGMPDNAILAYELAERYARKIQDSIFVLTFQGKKSNALIDKGEIEKALQIKEHVANKFKEMGFKQYAARTIAPCIKWYSRQGNYAKAKEAMDEYEAHSGYFRENGDIEPGREGYYYTKGICLMEQGGLDSANRYFRRLQHMGTTRNDQYLATWGLAQLYYKLNQMDSVGKYALQTLLHSDTLYNISAAQNLQNAQALYNYARHQENALRKEMEAKDAKYRLFQWITGSVLLIVLLTLFILWLRRQIKRSRSALRIAQEQNSWLGTEVQRHALTIEELNKQIEQKRNYIEELNAIINHNAADIELNEQLKRSVALLQQRLDAYQQEKVYQTYARDLNKLYEEPVVLRLFQMAKKRDIYPSIEEWHTFGRLMEECFPVLLRIKQMPDINALEYKICMLTKLGCDLSDIAYLTETKGKNLAVIRGRLLKKIFHTKEGGTAMFDRRMRDME